MSLRKWTIFLIGGTTLFLIGMTLAITTRTLTTHYEAQEKISVFFNIKRVLGAIDQQATFLEKISSNWAYSDDTYQYVRDQNPEYAVKNFTAQTFQRLGIDLMILVNSQDQVVFNGMTAAARGLDATIPLTLRNHLTSGDPILVGAAGKNTQRGLVLINGQPMLLSIHPILKADQSGLPGGALLTGKYLTSELINNIGSNLLLTINSVPISAVQNDADYIRAIAYQATDSEPYYIKQTPNLFSGYATLKDLFGQPMLLVQVDQYPTIYNNGLIVNSYLAVFLVVTALAFGILLFFLIQFNVLNRITRLGRDVLAIGASGDIQRRLSISNKDELSHLAGTINNTLNALEKAIFQRQESEERFRTLVESMEDVVFTVDRENEQVKVYTVDLPSEPGDTSSQVRQPAEIELDLVEQLASHRDLLNQTYQGRSTEIEWSSEKSDQLHYFIATLSPIYNALGEITSLVGVSKDITRQKQLEQDLRKRVNELGGLYTISQQLLNQVEFTATAQAICTLAIEQVEMQAAWIATPSPNGSVLIPSVSAGIDLTGLREIPIYPGADQPAEPVAQAFTSLEIHTTDLPQPGAYNQSSTQTSVAIPLINGSVALAVLVLVTKDATPIDADAQALMRAFMNLSSVAIQNAILFHQVINGRERFQAVSRRLVEVQEEERRRIALELHDEIGQVLTSLRFSIDLIKNMPLEKIESQVKVSTEMINDLIGRVRQISLDLRPSMLDDLGIAQTLLWFFDRYTSQTGIQVDFPPNNLGRRRFSSNLEITAYRVVQEALTNVARHAQVSTVTVRLWCTEKILGIQVEDQGVGFDVDAVFTSRNSKGLLGMWERIGYIGGQMDIVSEPGEGTSLSVEMPLEGILERRRSGR